MRSTKVPAGFLLLVSLAIPLSASSKKVATFLGILAIATMLQGCSVETVGAAVGAYHGSAAWETKPSYFADFAFIPEGKPVSEAVLNSCTLTGLPAREICSGNGVCTAWSSTTTQVRPLRFCLCDAAYADPECRTLRKSQAKAFVLSVFVGYLGLDRFYLGDFYLGIAKLSTLGGFGFWWMYDIVRIGSAPVYAYDYRVAADLPHTVYVVSVVLVAAALGYLVFGLGASYERKKRAKAQMLRKAEEAFTKSASATINIDPMDTVGMPLLAGNYGYPVQVHGGNPSVAGNYGYYGAMTGGQPFGGHSGRLGSF
jgi:hypothetical protein